MKGLREKVKNGEVSPTKALGQVGPDGSKAFIRWVSTTGVKRYKKALQEK